MTYRQLQQALKELRNQGTDVKVKLNAKYDVLLQEYTRLTQPSPEVTEAVVDITGKIKDSGLAVEYNADYDKTHTLSAFMAKFKGSYLLAFIDNLVLVKDGKAYPMLGGKEIDYDALITDVYNVLPTESIVFAD